jgi:hypothetical protein
MPFVAAGMVCLLAALMSVRISKTGPVQQPEAQA